MFSKNFQKIVGDVANDRANDRWPRRQRSLATALATAANDFLKIGGQRKSLARIFGLANDAPTNVRWPTLICSLEDFSITMRSIFGKVYVKIAKKCKYFLDFEIFASSLMKNSDIKVCIGV